MTSIRNYFTLPPPNPIPDPSLPTSATTRPHSTLFAPFLTALLLAAASCATHALLPHETGQAFAAVVVGALGGVYLGGALRGTDKSEIAISAIAAVICVALGAAGLLGPAWIIPASFILHGMWDWIHHALERRTVGHWWPPFCALYDFIFGAYLFVHLIRSGG